jgi:CarboxypepD_reg-like domain
MKKLVITFIAIVVSACSLYSQNKTIRGRVIDNHLLDTLAYVAIIINDTVQVGRTDLNGFFQIEIPVSEKKILFRSVGMEPATIELANTCDEVEVIMMFSRIYDFKTLKKVDRLRMKKFKKLPELHKEAFAKGIFKTDKACYTQEFIPSYKKKQK